MNIEMYSGYQNVTVLVGYVKTDAESALSSSLKNFEVFKGQESEAGIFTAVFVHNSEVAEAQRVLAQNGFAEVGAPSGEGSPTQMLDGLSARKEQLIKELDESLKRA